MATRQIIVTTIRRDREVVEVSHRVESDGDTCHASDPSREDPAAPSPTGSGALLLDDWELHSFAA